MNRSLEGGRDAPLRRDNILPLYFKLYDNAIKFILFKRFIVHRALLSNYKQFALQGIINVTFPFVGELCAIQVF